MPVMCRNQKDVDTRIHRMCLMALTTEQDMLDLAEKYLGIFRDVCRQTTYKASDTVNDLCSHVSEDQSCYGAEDAMSAALTELLFFASESQQERYDAMIDNTIQTAALIKLMDKLKLGVYAFEDYGPEFVNILSLCYMNTFSYTEDDILYTLNMGRSTFYKKKKRAMILFGLSIRGYVASLHGRNIDYIVESEGVQMRFECTG